MLHALVLHCVKGRALITVFATFFLSCQLEAQTYTITNLGTMPASEDTASEAYSINDYAQVVGTSGKRLKSQAFFWQDGIMSPLLPPAGLRSARPRAINNHNLIVGQAFDPNSISLKPVLWQDGNAQLVDSLMPPLRAVEASFIALNDSGRIIGHYLKEDGVIERGFVYYNNTVKDLGLLYSGGSTVPACINDQGTVTGISYTTDADGNINQQALFTWSPIQKISALPISAEDLNLFDLPQSSDINQAGTVVGFAQFDNGSDIYDAAIVVANGHVLKLPGLGGDNSYAYALNNSEQIVGSADTPAGRSHAVLWQSAVVSDLNQFLPVNSGWELLEAKDINSCGQIIGNGNFNGQRRAFLLSPQGLISCMHSPSTTPTLTPTPTPTPTVPQNSTPTPTETPTEILPSPTPSLPSLDPEPSETAAPKTTLPQPDSSPPQTKPTLGSHFLTSKIQFNQKRQRLTIAAKISSAEPSSCLFTIMAAEDQVLSLKNGSAVFREISQVSHNKDELRLTILGLPEIRAKSALSRSKKKRQSSKLERTQAHALALLLRVSCPGDSSIFSQPVILRGNSSEVKAVAISKWIKLLQHKLENIKHDSGAYKHQ